MGHPHLQHRPQQTSQRISAAEHGRQMGANSRWTRRTWQLRPTHVQKLDETRAAGPDGATEQDFPDSVASATRFWGR